MEKKEIKKVVLAYSGGLDTSIIIPWLKENYNNCEVIAVSGDVGQQSELEGLEEKALKTGASKLYIEDLRKEFIEDYIYPTMKAGAIYENKYLLGTSFARPVIAKRIVEIAKKEGADAICHGCTGKGNEDWNQSAPHGAGRLMSRSTAKESFTVSEFKNQMQGIYTTSVGKDTLDECPMAYKGMEDIVKNISDTAEIDRIIKPIYNFKAGGE